MGPCGREEGGRLSGILTCLLLSVSVSQLINVSVTAGNYGIISPLFIWFRVMIGKAVQK
jgi:hypothetical protein